MRLLPARRTPDSPARGQAMVEFALVLPILALLLVMAVDFGRVFFGWVALHNASRIAADFAASHTENWATSEDTYRALVRGDLESINCFPPGSGTWTDADVPDPDYPSGTAVGSPAVVGLECSFELITPLASSILGGQVSVGAESSFPIHKAIQQPLPPNTEPEPVPSLEPEPSLDAEPEECAAPNASFTTNPPPGQNGRVEGGTPLTVAFTDTSSAASECPITSWSWNFGSGSSTLPSPTHTFVHPGNGGPVNFNVVLTVINSEGSDTASVTVRVSR